MRPKLGYPKLKQCSFNTVYSELSQLCDDNDDDDVDVVDGDDISDLALALCFTSEYSYPLPFWKSIHAMMMTTACR